MAQASSTPENPTHQIFCSLTQTQAGTPTPFDLAIYDGQTGAQIYGSAGILVAPGAMTLSHDGSYLFSQEDQRARHVCHSKLIFLTNAAPFPVSNGGISTLRGSNPTRGNAG
jgi:hypothetical protein